MLDMKYPSLVKSIAGEILTRAVSGAEQLTGVKLLSPGLVVLPGTGVVWCGLWTRTDKLGGRL